MKRKVNGIRKGRYLITGMGIIFVVSAILISAPLSHGSVTKSPIKIGILYPFTGPFAFLGKRQLRGWEIALEKRDYKVNGRPIELVVEDSKGDPSTGVTKIKKLIEFDRVHALGGVVSSAVAYAIRDTVHSSMTPLVISMANAGGLTRERRSPYIFRTFAAGATASHYMAQFIYNELKLKKAVFTASDYAYGHEHAQMFKDEFERLGGEVLFTNFSPLGASDFGPYCTELVKYAGKAEVLHYVYSGADAIRFVKTAAGFGLQKNFTFTNWGGSEDAAMLLAMKSAAAGSYHIANYMFAVEFPENKPYLELNKKKGGLPDPLDYYGYLAAEALLHALEQVQGDVEEKDGFLKALRQVKFESPTGPFEFDPRSQNALVNLFIGQARKVDGEYGEYQNVVIKSLIKTQDPWWIGR